jgi:hypothetical protein
MAIAHMTLWIRWAKKDKRTNNDLQNITHKTKDRVTRTPLKTGGELRCSGRVSSSCSTSGTRCVNLVTNEVIKISQVSELDWLPRFSRYILPLSLSLSLSLYIYIYIYIFSINLVSFKVTLRSSGTDILLDCCQIIILSIYVPSTHAYTHVLRLSLDLPYETR